MTDWDLLGDQINVAPRATKARSDLPTVAPRQSSAGNDADFAPAVPTGEDTGAWARHASATNGFGDAATSVSTAVAAPPTLPSSYDLYHAARAHRSLAVGSLFTAAIRAVAAIARRALARHRQRVEARAYYEALNQLDNRTLRDLGLDRSELRSVVAEVLGHAEHTRARVHPLWHDPFRGA